MACEYFVNGQWLTETQFKKVLNDGLLDQLVVNQDFKVPGFEVNEDVLIKAAKKVEIGPVRLKVRHKIDHQINNQIVFEKAKEGEQMGQQRPKHPNRSLTELWAEYDKQIKAKNKKSKKKYTKQPLILAVRVGNKLNYGEKLPESAVKSITDSQVRIIDHMEEGKVYVLAPSAYGLYPLLLKSNFLGQTKVANDVKASIKTLFELKAGKAFDSVASDISRLLYQTTIEKTPEGIKVHTVKEGGVAEEMDLADASQAIQYILGEYDANGNLKKDSKGAPSQHKGLLAHVNHLKLNKSVSGKKTLSNKFYADNKFVVTDLYVEGGNFFNSTSFIMEAFEARGETNAILGEVLSDPSLIKTTQDVNKKAQQAEAKQEKTEKEVPNQTDKKDESPINSMSPSQVRENAVITVPIPNSNLSYKIYTEVKGNTLLMGKIEKGTIKKRKNANDVWQPVGEVSSTEASEARKLALPQFNKLKKDFGTKEATQPESSGEWIEPAKPEKEGGLFSGGMDMPLVVDESMLEEATPVTPEETVEPEEGDDFDYGTEEDGDALNLDPKARLEVEKEDATKWNREQELDWMRKKLGYELMDSSSTFNSLEDLKKYLPDETYEMLLEARKNGKFLHGLFTGAAVHIATDAYSGTGFHEAFHIVFSLALTLEQRLDLLEEAADKYQKEIIAQFGEDYNLIDIEEVLADKFMEYVQADEANSKSIPKKIARFFKALWRGIKLFFSKNSKVNIDTVFENIQLGVYANKMEFKNTDFSKIDPNDVKLRLEETPPIDPRIEYAGFQYFQHIFFQQLDKYEKDNPDVRKKNLSDSELIHHISKSEGGMFTVFGMMLNKAFADKRESLKAGRDVSELTRLIDAMTGTKYNPDGSIASREVMPVKVGNRTLPIYKTVPPKIAQKFNRFLRHYDININLDAIEDRVMSLDEESSFNQDMEESTGEERWQQAYIEINPLTTLTQKVKRKLGTIPKMVVIDGLKRHAENRFGAPIYYSEAEVFGWLGQNMTDTYNPSDMVKKLHKLQDKKPFVKNLIDMMDQDASFKTDLYNTLASKTFQKFLMVYEDKGDYRVFYSNRKTVDNLIKETVIADFIDERNEMFNKHEKDSRLKGQRNYEDINKTRAKAQLERVKEFKERAKDVGGKQSKDKAVALIKSLSKFYNDNYLNITEEQINNIWNPIDDKVQTQWENIVSLINSTEALFEKLVEGHNPFLEQRVEEGDYKSILHNFVSTLKPGLEKELNAAFRKGDNKTAYSIQYSNYLTKLVSRLKNPEEIQNYLEEISKDPLLRGMPLFDALVGEDRNSPTSAMDNMEVVILDSLARRGKNQNASYPDMSDIEYEAMAMSAFNISSKESKYGYYKLPTPSDGSVLPLIKFEKYDNQGVIDRLTKVAMAERARIARFNSLPKNSRLRNIPNYKDKAGTYQILSFLEGKIDENTDEITIRELIQEHLEGEFLELHKEKYKKAGIITSYEPGVNGKIIFADRVITKKRLNDATEFFKNYLYNSYLMNTQMTTIFAGDPAFYKGTTDYQKRYKQIISPGSLTNHEIVNEKYRGMIFNDIVVPTRVEAMETIIAMIDESDLPAAKKKELKARWEAAADAQNTRAHHNISDAATFVSVDRMMSKLASLNRLTTAHIEAAKRIKNGEEKASDAALFQVDKPFMFTKMNVDGVEVPFQLKNSEVLLTKAMAERKWKEGEEGPVGELKYPQLAEVYRLLNEPNENEPKIDFIAFESAAKEGAIGAWTDSTEEGATPLVDEKGNPRFNELVLNEEGNYVLNAEPAIVELYHEDWRLQQETPAHYQDDAGNFGTQLRNLIIGDMDMQGVYMVNGKPMRGEDVAREYQEIIVKNLEDSLGIVRDMFLTPLQPGQVEADREVDYVKLVHHLKEEFRSRNLDEEYFEAVELLEEVANGQKTGRLKTKLPLWHPVISYKVESLLNSFFKNNITKQKIKGGNMVNATSYGVSHTLKWIPETNTMQALLPWWSKKFFPQNEKGEVDITALPEQLRKMIGYRIPTEDKYSTFNIEVVGFTDAASGGTIILPAEATTLAGLDFDIDKLFMVIPEYRIDRNGNYVYKSYLDKTSSIEEVVDAIFESDEMFERFVEKHVPEAQQKRIREAKEIADSKWVDAIAARNEWKEKADFRRAVTRIKQLEAYRKEETNVSKIQAINNQLTKLRNRLKELDTFDGGEALLAGNQEMKDALGYAKLKIAVGQIVKGTISPEDYADFNTTATQNNRLLELMRGIMENPNTALSVLDPGNFDQLKEVGSKTRLLSISEDAPKEMKKLKKEALKTLKAYRQGKIPVAEYRDTMNSLADQLDSKDFNINYPATQLTLFRRNMTGKQLIGIFANHNAHHAKSQYTDLRLATPIYFNGIPYESLHNIKDDDGNRISKSLAIKLAAVVDNAKDPISAHLNMNTYTANLVAMLSRLGVNEDTIFAFINQPVIIELTNKYFNERGSLAEQKEMIAWTILKWKNSLEEQKIPQEKIDEIVNENYINLNLIELEESLDSNGSQDFYLTQYKVLRAFEEYHSTANSLNRVVQASRVDTNAMGPSNGDNYVMINKQQKILDWYNPDLNYKPKILGAEAFFKTTTSQLISPAFNENAWLEPVGIMNMIFPSIGKMGKDGTMKYTLLGRLKNYFSMQKGEAYSITEAEARKIDSMFMSYIASKLPFFERGQQVDILKNVPQRLKDFKKNNPTSIFLPFLDQLYTKDATRTVPMKRIEYYATGKTPLDHEFVRLSWKEMLKSENAEARKLAQDLVKYTYFSNGVSFGPFTFFNMVPVEFWTDSFANLDINKGLGLTDEAGHNYSTIAERTLGELENRAITNLGGNLHKDGAVYQFIKQFVQNTGEKSMIIPALPMKDIEDREYTPFVVNQLEETDVYVFATNEEGMHYDGPAGYAFKGTANSDSTPKNKGERGKWAEYGKTGQLMKGNQGLGFGIRMLRAEVSNGKITGVKGHKQIEDKAVRQTLLNNFKEDLGRLINIANQHPGKRFFVQLSTHHRADGRWDKVTMRNVINQVHANMGFPDNIKFARSLDPRISSSRYVGNNGKSLMIKKDSDGIKDYLINGEVFPDFFKITDNKVTKVFELQQESLDKPFIEYRRISLLGTTNFATELDYSKPIDKSVVPDILEDVVDEEAQILSQLYEDAPPITLDDSTLFTNPTDATIAEEKKTQEEDYVDPLGVINPDTMGMPIAVGLEIGEIDINSPVKHESYAKLAEEIGESPMPKEAWEATPIYFQQETMERLKKCRKK